MSAPVDSSRMTRVVVRRDGYGPVELEVSAERDHRKRRGLFFTPWPVAIALARLAQSHLSPADGDAPHVCDPFVGAGVLLAATVEALVEGSPAVARGDRRRQALSRVYGVDLDAAVLKTALATLWAGGRDQPPPGAEGRFFVFDTLASPASSAGGSAWERAFPEVFAEGGFDLVVTNPPWEKVRVNDREFFERVEPGFTRQSRGWRDRRRAELLARSEVATAYDAYRGRVAALKRAAAEDFVTSGSGGDLDTYKLAVERCVDIARPGGIVALVVPHGLLGDWGARRLRRWLFERHTVLDVVRFETGRELFPEIHANLGVVLLVLRKGAAGARASLRISAPVRDAAGLSRPHLVEVPLAVVSQATPHAMVPLVDVEEDLELLRRCAAFPSLWDWPEARFRPRREVDMTNDRHAFREVGEAVPLLEGKHLAPWRIDPAARRFDVLEAAVRWSGAARIAWRAVADRAMRRRLVAAWVPAGVALGNSLNFTVGETSERGVDDLLWLLAWMNSRVADAQLRLWCANNNINMYHLRSCRVPLPEQSGRAEAIVGLAAALTAAGMGCETPEAVRRRAVGARSASATELVERLDALWREVFGLDDRLWERAVAVRTTSVARWAAERCAT